MASAILGSGFPYSLNYRLGWPFPADPWDPLVFPGILLLHQVTKSGSFHSTVQLLQRVGRWRKTRVAFFLEQVYLPSPTFHEILVV